MALERLQYEFKVDGTLGVLLKAADMLDKIEGKFAKLAAQKVDFGATLRQAQGLEALNNSVQNITQAMSSAVMKTAELSDRMAIAQKNTGLTNAEMGELKNKIDSMKTRTSTADLFGIASSAGKLGVPKDEIADFVKVIDKASVALGDEFGGNVEKLTMVMGKIKAQYKEFAKMKFSEALNGIGSAINYLGKQGANSAPNVSEFTQRISTMGVEFAKAAGLGATLEELGLTAEIAAGGFKNIMTLAKTESATFAKHLRMPVKAFEDLINKDPNAVILKLAKSFEGASQTQIAQTMDKLKIGTQESQQVMSLLANNTEMLRVRQVQAAWALKKKNDLEKEAAIMNSTLAGQIAMTQKKFDEYTRSLGESLAPYMNVIQTTSFVTIGLAALIPIVSLMSSVLLGGFQMLIRYGLGLTFVNGKAAFAKSSLIGLIYQISRFAVITAVQGGRSLLLFTGKLFLMAAMALPALITSLVGGTGAMALFNAVTMINPFVLMMIGAVALIAIFGALIKYFGGFGKMIVGLWNLFLEYNIFSLIIKGIDALFGTKIFDRLRSFYKTIIDYLNSIWKKTGEFFNWVTGSSDQLKNTEQKGKQIKKGKEAQDAKDKAEKLELIEFYKKHGIKVDKDGNPIYSIDKSNTDYSSGLGSIESKKLSSEISAGGSKPTTINISIGKLNEKIEVSTINLKEGQDEIERIFTQLLLRVTNGANQLQGN